MLLKKVIFDQNVIKYINGSYNHPLLNYQTIVLYVRWLFKLFITNDCSNTNGKYDMIYNFLKAGGSRLKFLNDIVIIAVVFVQFGK